MSPYLTYWWFHLPNFILSALMYTVLGRFLLGLMVDPESKNYIWRAFVWLTEPSVRAVTAVTPRAVPHRVVLLFTAVWLLMARVALLILVVALGFAPAGGPAQ